MVNSGSTSKKTDPPWDEKGALLEKVRKIWVYFIRKGRKDYQREVKKYERRTVFQ